MAWHASFVTCELYGYLKALQIQSDMLAEINIWMIFPIELQLKHPLCVVQVNISADLWFMC